MIQQKVCPSEPLYRSLVLKFKRISFCWVAMIQYGLMVEREQSYIYKALFTFNFFVKRTKRYKKVAWITGVVGIINIFTFSRNYTRHNRDIRYTVDATSPTGCTVLSDTKDRTLHE